MYLTHHDLLKMAEAAAEQHYPELVAQWAAEAAAKEDARRAWRIGCEEATRIIAASAESIAEYYDRRAERFLDGRTPERLEIECQAHANEELATWHDGRGRPEVATRMRAQAARWLNGEEALPSEPMMRVPCGDYSRYRRAAQSADDWRRHGAKWEIVTIGHNAGRYLKLMMMVPDALPADLFDRRTAACDLAWNVLRRL